MTGQTNHSTNAGSTPPSGAELAALLEDRLVGEEWPPGAWLPSERALALQYSVSRPVIREALRSLQERGLIGVAPGRGSFVREVRPTSDGGDPLLLVRRGEVTARHLVVARVMLEGQAAALAAQYRSEDDLAHMRRILADFERQSVLSTAADLDVAFHEAIAIASRNPVIQIMFGSIRPLTHGVVLRSLTDRAVSGAAVPLHAVILDAIANGDPDVARAAMTEHIEAAQYFYGPDLDVALTDVLRRRAARAPDVASVLSEVSRSIADLPAYGRPVSPPTEPK
ncbi:FadR/GntR family transcriptional regulator [Embleya scabrispora]|uniref:FadR/GntR family transcriptional regulator n=1 Tax=Embleya scabrispora TaxID=159449 RepID=UPI00035D47F5|nr:FadR/GntR family transcriptional regulator [Embleya scabrispora]MYS81071.1 FCD domain-containing protein [Streptomyces sp. SID5474]